MPARPLLPLGERTLVVGVLNATADSFSGDGLGDDTGALVALGRDMVAAGADVLDVGAASSRPGAAPVHPDVERERARRTIAALRARVGVPISIDTVRAEVAAAGLDAGASLVNDVSGLADPRLAALAAEHGAWLVVAHSGRRAGNMPHDPSELVGRVAADLEAAVGRAERAGLPRDRILVDPGLGFGKSAAESFALVRELARIRAVAPVLVGPSRKSHLGAVTGRAVGERVFATAAAVAAAILSGADAVRVHDVGPMVDVVRVADAVRYPARALVRVVYVGLGSNVGDRAALLRRAVAALGTLGRVRAVSGLWETAPLLVTDQPAFLNAVVALEAAAASPAALVARLKAIERELGRAAGPRYGPRAIDLDLLLAAGSMVVVTDGDVVVPHPALHERRFVLEPLAELAPDEVDPRTGRSVRDLRERVCDQDATRIAGSEWWTTASS